MSLHDTLRQAQTRALIEVARKRPETTLTELVSVAKQMKVDLRSVCIGDLIGVGTKSAAAPNGATTNGAWSTRTPADRAALDKAVCKMIDDAGAWVRAEEFRVKFFPGLSPLQFRKSCKRLIRDKRIAVRGQARGTEYKAN